MRLPRWYWLRRLICWWIGCDISEINGDFGCDRCWRNVRLFWECWLQRDWLNYGDEAVVKEIPKAVTQPTTEHVATPGAPNVEENGWLATQFHGFGCQWKCATCGKYSNHLRNNIGLCCSPELQEQARYLAEAQKRKSDLAWALQTRILTDEEMLEVMGHNYYLLVRENTPYRETEIREQFSNLLSAQFRLKTILAQVKRDASKTEAQ